MLHAGVISIKLLLQQVEQYHRKRETKSLAARELAFTQRSSSYSSLTLLSLMHVPDG